MSKKSEFYETAEDVIKAFYKACHKKEFQVAFDCLTSDFQERVWEGNVNRFAIGYQYTQEIHEPVLAVIEEEDYETTILVYYTEKIEALRHPLLNDLKNAGIRDLDHTAERIAKFRTLMLEELEGDEAKIDDTMISHFFTDNNVEVALWLGKTNIKKHDQFFTKEVTDAETARKAICVKTEKQGWKIEGLRYIK